MNHSFLTVRGLDYSIDGTEILQDVSLEVPEGTFVGLIGPNGCGKSTLLKNIYKTYRPQKDTVYIDGKDVVSLSAKEMARQAAVVAQENQTEFDLEVLDMVMYGRYAHRRFLEKETEEDNRRRRDWRYGSGLPSAPEQRYPDSIYRPIWAKP